jgi:hypothetical protein
MVRTIERAKSRGIIMTIIEMSDERSRSLHKNLEGTRDQGKPMELNDVLLGIIHRLDDGTSKLKAVYDHLLAIENDMKGRARKFRPLSSRDLYRCCSHRGLAILRRGTHADNRGKGSGAWLVAGGQADDRELGAAPWPDETTCRSRKHCCSAIRAGDASGNGCADRARESACQLPGAGTSDSGGSRRAGANRGPARRQSRPDGAPDRCATDLQPGNPCLQPGNSCEDPSASSATTHCCPQEISIAANEHSGR